MMKLKIYTTLLDWKERRAGKTALLIDGARRVGKSYIVEAFAKKEYRSYILIDFFTASQDVKDLFENYLHDLDTFFLFLSNYYQVKLYPRETLIIFDEVQECPEALNALKYFKEKANEYHVIAAGSLLGTLLAQPKSYPVGMVNLLEIQPLTFDEFLEATDESLFRYYERIEKGQFIEEIFHKRLLDAYHNYLIIGGMPECVASWEKYRDPARIDQIQRELIEIYENDFSKHNGKVNSGRILMVFRSIVSQLAKPNEKFMYGAVRSGGRARDFEEAIEWLVSAGMVNRVYNVSKMEHPLTAFDKLDYFKLFLFDTGLLKHMAGIDNGTQAGNRIVAIEARLQGAALRAAMYHRSFDGYQTEAPSRSRLIVSTRLVRPTPIRVGEVVSHRGNHKTVWHFHSADLDRRIKAAVWHGGTPSFTLASTNQESIWVETKLHEGKAGPVEPLQNRQMHQETFAPNNAFVYLRS